MRNWTKNVSTFLGCDSGYDEAEAVIFGAPFDGTTSYRPGTRFASRVMRAESYGLETYSPYQDKDILDLSVFDGGDLDLPFGNVQAVLRMIEEKTDDILQDKKLPIMIGGEHLATLGAVRAAARRYPDLYILHFDAHADVREDYLGETLSHATVMRRCWDILGDGRIFQFGIRSGDREEFQWAKEHVIQTKFDFTNLQTVVSIINKRPVYLTIDLDVLDPSCFPGTGTPEAGGVSFGALLSAIVSLRKLRVVGCDLMELSPPYDPSGTSTATALKVLRELLLTVLKTKD